jgi:hypothetical protein
MASTIAAPSAAAFSSIVSASAASATCSRQATYMARPCPYSRALPKHNGLSAANLPLTKIQSSRFRPVAPCRAKVVSEAKQGARVKDPCAEGGTLCSVCFLYLKVEGRGFGERSSRAYLYCTLKSEGTWCSVVKVPGAWLVVLNIAYFGSQTGLCGKDGQKS